ncbi:MAG: WG repeat-containing protein [Chitinophaga sp.]|uniref:WG repeat-containing protein n=1 Tax=Chitinophaga sp. TaxID=1869181 RepID=UPI001B04DEF4|nr:WG repeat-containing protein [Chitinophaga sp.]MBO9731319.1 WG repeat-containing protein [Chitinophaga sp.]
MNKRLLLAGGWLLVAPHLMAQKGSAFSNGLARLEENEQSWYINAKGEKMFDQALATYHPLELNFDHDNNNHQLLDMKATHMLVSRNGKMGVIDGQGKWLLQPVYDTIDYKWKTYLELHQGNKMTYADSHGKLLLPMQFDTAGILDEEHFDVKLNDKYGVFSASQNKLVIPAQYDAFDYCGGCGSKSNYVFAQRNGKWGVLDFNNNILVPFEYEHEHAFMRSDNWILSFKKEGQDVVINMGNKAVYSSPEYTNMELISGHLLKAKKNNYYGLIDENGTQVADFVYEGIESQEDRYAGRYLVITKQGKTGIIREDGKVIIPPAYEGDVTVYDEYFVVPVNGDYNLLDTTGKKLLPVNYTAITGFNAPVNTAGSLPLFKLKQKALYGFYNPGNKKTVAPAFFDIDRTEASSPLAGLLETEYQEKKGLYSITGEQVLPAAYEDYGALSDQLLWVKQHGNTGLYDRKNKRLLLPAMLFDVSLLEGDSTLVVATKNISGNYNKGLYDVKGPLVQPLIYSSIQNAGRHNYLLTLERGGKTNYSLFNSSTRQLKPLLYDRVVLTPDPEAWIVEKKGQMGIINSRGQVVVPIVYEKVMYLRDNVIKLLKKGANGIFQLGYADNTGKIIVPLIYDGDEYAADRPTDSGYLLLTKRDEATDNYLQGLAANSGQVVVPPVYDRVLYEINGLGFLAQRDHLFMVLDKQGKPVSKELFDDVMLGEAAGYGASNVTYSFPLLCRNGNTYRYLREDGSFLSLQITEVIPFSPYDLYGIPEL